MPKRCNVTGLPDFGKVGDRDTFGGPFDSYTLPRMSAEGEFFRERYDHDEGGWVDGVECLGIFAFDDQDLFAMLGNRESLTVDELFAVCAKLGSRVSDA